MVNPKLPQGGGVLSINVNVHTGNTLVYTLTYMFVYILTYTLVYTLTFTHYELTYTHYELTYTLSMCILAALLKKSFDD